MQIKLSFKMGGPCWLVLPPGGSARRTKAPPCTDNFQVAKFEHKGSTWHSVEQCYQAMKFEEGSKMRARLQAIQPSSTENDSAFGMRVWRDGQLGKPVADWEERKVEEMLASCLAKYIHHPEMQEELVKETSDLEIQGAPSTWQWQLWNGKIQMKIRNLLASGVDLHKVKVAFPGDEQGLKRADLL